MSPRTASRGRVALGATVACLVATACYAPPIEAPPTGVTQETPIRVPPAQNQVDILFMIDNSQSMDAMQSELRARFGDFLSVFDDLAARGIYADLHIGVVTSDYGAGDKAKVGGCDASPGGQRGLLQPVGALAPSGCMGPTGARYLAYAYGADGATHNLPAGQTLAETFTCMASVGSQGCGFEHQLESVYAALHNTVENAGFVRDDALLAVVFVTNEDDGSAPPTTTIYEDDGGLHGAYGSYRQTRYGIACGTPLQLPPYGDSHGPLDGCVPAPNRPDLQIGEEYDIGRYIELFTQPPKRHGIKRSQNDVILIGLDGPESPVEIIQAVPKTGLGMLPKPAYEPCGPTIGDGCAVTLQHSCQNRVQPAFFADPSVRLNAVINAVPTHATHSICGDDLDRTPDFSTVLAKAARLINGNLGGCIPAVLSDPAHPECVVEDVAVDDAGVDQITEIASCQAAPGQLPCWRIEEKEACAGSSPQSLGITIDRGGMHAPPDTGTRVFCSTLAN